MDLIIACVFVLVFIAVSLVLLAIFQIRMAGIKIKDFYGFIQANQMLDKLARFARRYENMSPQEQHINNPTKYNNLFSLMFLKIKS